MNDQQQALAQLATQLGMTATVDEPHFTYVVGDIYITEGGWEAECIGTNGEGSGSFRHEGRGVWSHRQNGFWSSVTPRPDRKPYRLVRKKDEPFRVTGPETFPWCGEGLYMTQISADTVPLASRWEKPHRGTACQEYVRIAPHFDWSHSNGAAQFHWGEDGFKVFGAAIEWNPKYTGYAIYDKHHRVVESGSRDTDEAARAACEKAAAEYLRKRAGEVRA